MSPSTRSKLEKYAVLVLAAVFALTLANALRRSGVLSRPVTAPRPLVPGAKLEVPLQRALRGFDDTRLEELSDSPPAASSDKQVALLPPSSDESLYTAQDLRDPLHSLLPGAKALPEDLGSASAEPGAVLAQEAPPPPSLVVQGMLWGGSEPTAIINDHVYRVGESVQGARIRSIDRGGVSMEFQGSTWRLTPRAE